MKNALLIFAFLSFYLSSVHASVEIRSNKLTTGDGLANNSIRYMFQDSKGFMWMGTVNGLSYYDGNSFVSIYPTLICRFHWPTRASGIWKKILTVFYGSPLSLLCIAVTI